MFVSWEIELSGMRVGAILLGAWRDDKRYKLTIDAISFMLQRTN
jgi:hypothetical protein